MHSFAQRMADQERRTALDTLTVTERLLVQILIEVMETRAHRNHAEIANRLRNIGLSAQQIAALLDTTPASIAVSRRRAVREDPIVLAHGGEVETADARSST